MKDKVVCFCKNVSEKTVIQAIQQGATSLKMVRETTGACMGNQCKELNPKGVCCSNDILALIEEVSGIQKNGHDSECCKT